MRKFFLVLVLLMLSGDITLAQSELQPSGRVNDFAHILQPDIIKSLEYKIDDIDVETTVEVTIVTIESLEGYTPKGFADRLGNAWGVGKSGKNNGIVILVAPNERQCYITVANGLTKSVSNQEAQRIATEVMAPKFKSGSWFTGLSDGLDELKPLLPQSSPTMQLWKKSWIGICLIAFLSLATVVTVF